MAYIKIKSAYEFKLTLFSIPNSVVFRNYKDVYYMMESIGLKSFEESDDHLFVHYCGFVNDIYVNLFFESITSENNKMYLRTKAFGKRKTDGNLTVLRHSFNDQPSLYHYDLEGEISRKTYHKDGKVYRSGHLPCDIDIKKNIIKHLYSRINQDLSICSIIINNKSKSIVDSTFYLDKKIVEFEQIRDVVERIDKFSINQIIDIHKHLTHEEVLLLSMIHI